MIHYPIPPHKQNAYTSLGYQKGDFCVAEEIADTCLSLPIWPGMTNEQIGYVTTTISNFFHT
jgi:dTDP-4-amino-4,6-dideoxygalactose transaminase